MTQQCVFCGHGQLVEKHTRYIYQKNEQLFVVEQVPCTECQFCGEQYFDFLVLQKIENDYNAISTNQKQPQRLMQVAVENFAALT